MAAIPSKHGWSKVRQLLSRQKSDPIRRATAPSLSLKDFHYKTVGVCTGRNHANALSELLKKYPSGSGLSQSANVNGQSSDALQNGERFETKCDKSEAYPLGDLNRPLDRFGADRTNTESLTGTASRVRKTRFVVDPSPENTLK